MTHLTKGCVRIPTRTVRAKVRVGPNLKLGVAKEFIVGFQARVDTRVQSPSQVSAAESGGEVQIKQRSKTGALEQEW